MSMLVVWNLLPLKTRFLTLIGKHHNLNVKFIKTKNHTAKKSFENLDSNISIFKNFYMRHLNPEKPTGKPGNLS